MKYPVLDFHTFSDLTLTSKDLDPIYVALLRMNLSCVILNAWLIAYWCLYNAASASILVSACSNNWWTKEGADLDAKKFYALLTEASQTWPHGFERRHFRGRKAIDAGKSVV